MATPKTGRILSVRVSAPLERRLEARARAEKTTESELIRTLLEHGLDQAERESLSTAGERAGHLFGLIDEPGLPQGKDARKHLAKWKPTRRG